MTYLDRLWRLHCHTLLPNVWNCISNCQAIGQCSFCYYILDSLFIISQSLYSSLSNCPTVGQCSRQLTENIPNWAFYPQLGIQKHQLRVSHLIGDWVFIFWLSCPFLDIPNPHFGNYPQLGILYSRLGIIYPIWDIFC